MAISLVLVGEKLPREFWFYHWLFQRKTTQFEAIRAVRGETMFISRMKITAFKLFCDMNQVKRSSSRPPVFFLFSLLFIFFNWLFTYPRGKCTYATAHLQSRLQNNDTTKAMIKERGGIMTNILQTFLLHDSICHSLNYNKLNYFLSIWHTFL